MEICRVTRVLLMLGMVSLAACSQGQRATASPATYHVDYTGGSDSAAGTSPATAWKHAPGDPNATGVPGRLRLQPGDTVLLRGGVPYRGAITLRSSGTADAPITYSGTGFGAGLGMIDGSEPIRSVRPCSSAADCGGAGNWQQLHRITFTQPNTRRLVLFGKTNPYWLSQVPHASDPFLAEDTSDYVVTPLSSLAELQAGRLQSPELARAAASGGKLELAFWVVPNFVRRVPVLAVEGDTLRFDPEGIRFYEDRDGRAALSGSFAGMHMQGMFLQLSDGVIIARLRPEDSIDTLAIGAGRFAIEAAGQSHIRITGIHFRNLSGSAGVQGEGRAFSSTGPGATDIELKGNLFGPAFIEESNSGLIRVVQGRNIRFISNRIENISVGTAMSLGGHNVGDLLIEGNVIRRIGRSGIYMLGLEGATVRGNILAEVRGIHGNAITAYLGNRNILIEGNCVVSSDRPITYHGDRTPELVNGITIRNNILVAAPGGQAAINSWGRDTNTVTISGNILAGARHGILLNGSDRNVIVEGNDTSGIAINGTAGPGWRIANNSENLTLARAVSGHFSEDGCSVPESRLDLKVVRTPN